MITQEQELTFDNIDNFFQLSGDLIDQIESNIDNLSKIDLLSRVNIIEEFINQTINISEIIAENFHKLINKRSYDKKILQQEIADKITELLLSLEKTKENLLAQI